MDNNAKMEGLYERIKCLKGKVKVVEVYGSEDSDNEYVIVEYQVPYTNDINEVWMVSKSIHSSFERNVDELVERFCDTVIDRLEGMIDQIRSVIPDVKKLGGSKNG